MDTTDIFQWIEAGLRWVHIFAGILWIGQTWLFHWFDKNLEKADAPRKGSHGTVWMVHGGHMFAVEKTDYPDKLPEPLHWFKWESFTTWAAGMLLLVVTYYWPGQLLCEPEQKIGLAHASATGLFVGGWLVYDLAVRSPLRKNMIAFAVLSLAVLIGLAYGLRFVMSPRAVYIHLGMMLGTIMMLNVWMRILPSQRKMLALAKEGKPIDKTLGETGPARSKHNAYMVVPLVFLMISNHYPSISFGHDKSYLIFGVMVIVGWIAAKLVRHD